MLTERIVDAGESILMAQLVFRREKNSRALNPVSNAMGGNSMISLNMLSGDQVIAC